MRQYRYTLSLEGNDVATDLKWKLASGLVVLMPTPTTESWLMEFALQPGVHYVAVETPADVPVKLAELRARPEEAERISGAARAWMVPFTEMEEETNLQRDVIRAVASLIQPEAKQQEKQEGQQGQPTPDPCNGKVFSECGDMCEWHSENPAGHKCTSVTRVAPAAGSLA